MSAEGLIAESGIKGPFRREYARPHAMLGGFCAFKGSESTGFLRWVLHRLSHESHAKSNLTVASFRCLVEMPRSSDCQFVFVLANLKPW